MSWAKAELPILVELLEREGYRYKIEFSGDIPPDEALGLDDRVYSVTKIWCEAGVDAFMSMVNEGPGCCAVGEHGSPKIMGGGRLQAGMIEYFIIGKCDSY